MNPTHLAVREARLKYQEIPSRVPLKFGRSIVDRICYCTASVAVENSRGERAEGTGSTGFGSPWSFPSPEVSYDLRLAAMKRLAEQYRQQLADADGFFHPIELWFQLRKAAEKIGRAVSEELALPAPLPKLAINVAVAPFDAAVHDAFGRLNQIASYDGYNRDYVSDDLGRYLGPSFSGRYLNEFLRSQPTESLPVFHLVGALDKLTEDEITEADPCDGHPVSLDQWIARDGVFCFKMKLSGTDLAWDLDRTTAIERVANEALRAFGSPEIRFTADFNEVCATADYVVEYLVKLKKRSSSAYHSLQYIEQPTKRELSDNYPDMAAIGKLKPVLADESLADPEDIDPILRLGWSGIALKVCKGHTPSLLSLARAEQAGLACSIQDSTNSGTALVHSAGFTSRIHAFPGFEYNSRQFRPAANDAYLKDFGAVFIPKAGWVSTKPIRALGLGY